MSSRKKWIVASIIVVLIVSLVSVFVLFAMQPRNIYFSMKAVIVDQLAEDSPNPLFRQNVTTLLSDYGFTVSYYNDTDVEFFTHLAESDYGIIVLRAHMALRMEPSPENGTEVPVAVDLFTSEPYDETKHVAEQNAELLSRGELPYSEVKYYFAITPQFIEKLQGTFPHSLIIATGCYALEPGLTEMVNAFVSKGSKVFIGWTNLVSSSHSDEEVVSLVQRLVENRTIEQALKYVLPEGGIFGNATTLMDYYPRYAGDLKISDLVAESSGYVSAGSLYAADLNRGFKIVADADVLTRFYSRLEIVWSARRLSLLDAAALS